MSKNHEDKEAKTIRAVARKIAAAITSIPHHAADEATLTTIESLKCKSDILGDVVHLLDSQPQNFPDHKLWHPRLRRLRNNPELGVLLLRLPVE